MAGSWGPDEVLAMASSYQAACVLAAAAELDLFTSLQGQPLPAGEIARQIQAEPRATAVLLDALAALGLLEKEQDLYSVPHAVENVLTDGGELSKLAMVQHQANCLRRWADLARVVKTGEPAERPPSIRGADADQAAFIEAMDNVSAPMAGPLVGELQPLAFTHLLDIGGASGTWTIALLRAVPDATATIFDLPTVVPFARARIAAAGLADRVAFAEGDYHADPLPAGADFAWISAIIHQNSREQNRALYRKVHDALQPGGQIAIRDIVLDETRTRPVRGALFAVNMLVGTEGGGCYTLAEIREDLEAAGFGEVALWREGEGMDSVVRAVKR